MLICGSGLRWDWENISIFLGKVNMRYIKKSLSKIGKRNPQWKGDNVGTNALHEWVRGRCPSPPKCQRCGKSSPLDLANKNGNYNRNLDEWWWLCRKCHMESDGRLSGLRERNKLPNWERKKTHCPQGHPYNEENTYFDSNGWRVCKTCRIKRTLESYYRKKQAYLEMMHVPCSNGHKSIQQEVLKGVK